MNNLPRGRFCSFRPFEKDDGENLYNAIKGKETVKHMVSNGFSKDDCEWIVNDNINHWEKYGYGSWAVIDPYNNDVIGWAGFKFWKENEVEFLCVLGLGQWGKGKEILELLLNYGFNELGFKKIYILLPLTRKTFNFVKRYGFKECGIENFENEEFMKFKIEK